MSNTFPVITEEDYADDAISKIQERDLLSLKWMIGNEFPDSTIENSFFHKLDESTVYKYENGNWLKVFSYSPGYYTENELRNLFQSKNATLDALSYEIQEYPQWSIFGFNSLITCKQNWFLSICVDGTIEEFKRYSGCKNLAYKNEVGTADFSDGVIRETHLSDEILTEHQHITGDVVLSNRSASTSEWIKLDGKSTLGGQGSTYSGSAYKNLYDKLWNREDVVLQNSIGTIVSKGSDPTSDWQSNKQIVLNWSKPNIIIKGVEFDLFNSDNTIWKIKPSGEEVISGNLINENYTKISDCLADDQLYRIIEYSQSNSTKQGYFDSVGTLILNFDFYASKITRDVEEDFLCIYGHENVKGANVHYYPSIYVCKNGVATRVYLGSTRDNIDVAVSCVKKHKGYYYFVVSYTNGAKLEIYRSEDLLSGYELYKTINDNSFNRAITANQAYCQICFCNDNMYLEPISGGSASVGVCKIDLENEIITNIYTPEQPTLTINATVFSETLISNGKAIINYYGNYNRLNGNVVYHCVFIKDDSVFMDITSESYFNFSYTKIYKDFYVYSNTNASIVKYNSDTLEQMSTKQISAKILNFNVYDVDYTPDTLPGYSFFVKK